MTSPVNESAPQSETTDPRSRRSRSIVLGVVLAALLAAAALVVAFVNARGDTAADRQPPSATQYGAAVQFTLEPRDAELDDAIVEATAQLLEGRLEAIGAGAEVRARNASISLTFPSPPDPSVLDRLLAPSEIGLRPVLRAENGNPSDPPPPQGDADRPAEPAHPSDAAYYLTDQVLHDLAVADCAALAPAAAENADGVLIACTRPGAEGSLTKFALGPVEISGERVEHLGLEPMAGAETDPGTTAILIRLDGEGRSLLREMTGRLMSMSLPQNQLAVVAEGHVVTAPSVMDTIPSGDIQIAGDHDVVVALGFGRSDMIWRITAWMT